MTTVPLAVAPIPLGSWVVVLDPFLPDGTYPSEAPPVGLVTKLLGWDPRGADPWGCLVAWPGGFPITLAVPPVILGAHSGDTRGWWAATRLATPEELAAVQLDQLAGGGL